MAAGAKYATLFEPGHIGILRTKNRLVKTGSHPGFFPYEDGYVPQAVKDYYGAMARGGVGLIVVGAAELDYPIGTVPGMGYRIDDDAYIEGLRDVAEAIRAHDCRAFIQVFHMGPMHPEVVSGHQPVAASSLAQMDSPRPQFFVARELTALEIEGVVHKFVAAAVRAQKAGFEGVEVNAACNHLLNSFLSRAWNKRTDVYGCGSLADRARMVVEIIRGIKEACGPDFAVIALLNGTEPGLPDGITLDESIEFARLFESAGADAMHVRAEFYSRPKNPSLRESTHFPDVAIYPDIPYPLGDEVDTGHHGAGGWVPMAAAVKKVVSVPVIAVGRLDADLGEKLLRSGVVDFVGMNRRLVADHDLPTKLAEGRLEDIAPCTACMTCFAAVETGQFPRCRVNAALGREGDYEIVPAARKKRVLVVGGGPAGMEVARVAALRGHAVTLCEKGSRLGGSLPVANLVKGFDREDLLGLARYLETQVRKLGVEVHLGVEVDRSVAEGVAPDVVVVAAGGEQCAFDLPGMDHDSVVTGSDLHAVLKRYLRFVGPRRLRELTRVWMPLGKKVVVIGGGIHGCQTAEFLVKRGRIVTIVETSDDLGTGIPEALLKPYLINWLTEHGARMLTGVAYECVTDDGLVVTTREGDRVTLEADTVLTALPLLPNTALCEVLRGSAPEVYAIGDSREPGLIVDAIADGSRVGRVL